MAQDVFFQQFFQNVDASGIMHREAKAVFKIGAVPRHIDFRNNLDKIFSRYQEAVKGIVGLMDIDIQNPVNCLHLIMKELKINQKIRNEVVELFVGQYGEEPCTAHDLYFAMHEAAFFAACEGFSAPRILKLEEDIAKTLVFDWKGFDVYGTIKL